MKPKAIISLCDYTGIFVKPWTDAGYTAVIVDTQHTGGITREGNLIKVGLTIEEALPFIRQFIKDYDVLFVAGFPPCTDLAVSGARHFQAKAERDKHFQAKAVQIVWQCQIVAEMIGCPFLIENPTSVLSSIWRKPNFIFNPCDFGGYLPEDDEHPEFPEYITPRDAYPKKTCLWTGGGFSMPVTKPVESVKDYPGWTKLGGKSLRTKNIRSATPRGFAQAVFEKYGASDIKFKKVGVADD